jgi:drug/metabolite transporter (DMT)-like permease
MDNRLLTALLLLMTAVWGCTFTVVKDAATAYGVFSFLAVRFSIGLLSLSAFAWRNLEKKSLLAGLGIGIPLAMGYLLQTWGLKYTTPTNSGLITSFLVIAAPLFNRTLFGVRTRPILWAAIGLTMAGMLCLTGIGWSPLALGDSMTLGAAIAFGLQIALLDRYAKHFCALSVATGQTAAAAAIFLVAWPLTEPVCWPSGGVWTAILLTGIVATAGGFYVQTLAQRKLPAVRFVVIVSLEAVFALLFGYVLAGDRLTGIQIFGAILMLAAVVLVEIVPVVLPRKRAKDIKEASPAILPREENLSAD